jgi:hypothetical protein
MSTPTIAQLKRAIALTEQIETLRADIASLFSGSPKVSAPVTTAPVAKAKKGGMSAEGRARVAAAQKARWAKVKGQKAAPVAAPVKGKRTISAAHREKLKAAAKARWARAKKGK